MPSKLLSVSVVIPNHNGKRLLAQHLPKVIEAVPNGEIVVVDDASDDGSVAFLRTNYPQVRVIALKTNVRFARACNEGVKAARGEIVVLLNSDVTPDKMFLLPLIESFKDEAVFAVGCKELSTENNRVTEQGKANGAFKRGFIVHWRSSQQTSGATLWAFGGSSAFDRAKWSILEGMDPLFAPAYEEDRDLSYRALKRGWKVLFTSESQVYHQHESTNLEALGKETMQVSSYKNHCLMVWKNITYKPYLIQHLLWLPYHIIITTFRTRGAFLKGFLQALIYLPRIKELRNQERTHEKVSDKSILSTRNT